MKLELFKTLWGHDGTLEEAVALAVHDGFRGIEAPVPESPDECGHFIQTLRSAGFDLIAEISTCTRAGVYVPDYGKTPQQHLDSLEAGIIRSLQANPRFINTMAGYDAWSFEEALEFFRGLLDLEQRHGIAISAETHRGRSTYSPWLSRRIFKELPDLKITCDFSHWCVVSERLILDEELELLAEVSRHAFHIQSRVGYAQGPQVPDPRAPEYAAALEAHERWWDAAWESMAARSVEIATLTPEFGPDGYLQAAPFTGVPVADLWEINRWIALRELGRFNQNHS